MKGLVKTITTFFIIGAFLLPFFTYAQSINSGIIEGIWFSEDEYVVGDTVRIYTAVQNNSGDDISGEVHFLDNDQPIGVKTFRALDDRITEVWIDVTAQTEGIHEFSVSVENVKADGVDVLTPNKRVSRGSVIIYRDTDGDGVPDEDDNDDDNDGFSDAVERRLGTDPLDRKSVPTQEEESIESQEISSVDLLADDISGPLPELVLSTVENLPLLTPLVSGINGVQNEVLLRIQKEQEVLEVDETKKPWYEPGLPVFQWLFSCFWCASILLLAALYLVTKIIFKILRMF